MRAFPIDDKDNSVGEIVEQLCDLINSGEGTTVQFSLMYISQSALKVMLISYDFSFN